VWRRDGDGDATFSAAWPVGDVTMTPDLAARIPL
jgi:hypothetical protein